MATWKILVGIAAFAVLGVAAIFVHNALWKPKETEVLPPQAPWLEVKPDKETYIVGEPVILNLIIHNDGDKEVYFGITYPTEDYVTVAMENSNPDAVVKVGREIIRLGGFRIGRRIKIEPGESTTLPILLSKWYRFDKPGKYSGELVFSTSEPQLVKPSDTDMILKADFKFQAVEGSLEELAKQYYGIRGVRSDSGTIVWYTRMLSYMHADAAIEYLEKIILEKNRFGDGDIACDGLARIESPASATELVKLAESTEISEQLSYRCKALCVQIFKNTKNQEVRKIVEPVAVKYPNVMIPVPID
jgi:hypothetical protein